MKRKEILLKYFIEPDKTYPFCLAPTFILIAALAPLCLRLLSFLSVVYGFGEWGARPMDLSDVFFGLLVLYAILPFAIFSDLAAVLARRSDVRHFCDARVEGPKHRGRIARAVHGGLAILGWPEQCRIICGEKLAVRYQLRDVGFVLAWALFVLVLWVISSIPFFSSLVVLFATATLLNACSLAVVWAANRRERELIVGAMEMRGRGLYDD